MDIAGEGAKTKTLAVFQNVVTKERRGKRKRFKPHRFSDDESSPSDSELVIDDEVKEETHKRKKSTVRIRLKEEELNMQCEWDCCPQVFSDPQKLFNHLESHLEVVEAFKCKWADCPNPDNILSHEALLRHVAYHGYLAKLVNIGENVLKRNDFPECSLERKYSIDIPLYYTCDWKDCDDLHINNIHDFLAHVECHILAAPSGKKLDFSDTIPCLWRGCVNNYSTRYKLADHMKVHTKEKVIACPQCMSLFSTKTTFSDHRKRQLKADMRSFQCSQCLKLFAEERLLSDHMRSHINQYKCTLCDMTSPKPSMLAKHYRYRHMDVRPFSCQNCEKTFVTKSNLNTHLLTHQVDPFKCDQCAFGCKSRGGLKNHMIKVHGLESATYECQVCKLQFKRGGYLTYHLIKKHKFHWPSGHCRFRYRKDSDGIHRLQTVRYESLEVTEQVIKSESMRSTKNPSGVTYNVTYVSDLDGGYKLTVQPEENEETKISVEDDPLQLPTDYKEIVSETSTNPEERKVIIIVEDVDESGNVVQSTEYDSEQIFCYDSSETEPSEEKVAPSRDMPVFETIDSPIKHEAS